jgi:hypothetical protein
MGPVPAAGATVSDLYAQTSANVGGGDTADVTVIDNTTGTTLLTCEVTVLTTNNCEDALGSATAAAGDSIEVEITDNSSAVDGNLWRVSFRY